MGGNPNTKMNASLLALCIVVQTLVEYQKFAFLSRIITTKVCRQRLAFTIVHTSLVVLKPPKRTRSKFLVRRQQARLCYVDTDMPKVQLYRFEVFTKSRKCHQWSFACSCRFNFILQLGTRFGVVKFDCHFTTEVSSNLTI